MYLYLDQRLFLATPLSTIHPLFFDIKVFILLLRNIRLCFSGLY